MVTSPSTDSTSSSADLLEHDITRGVTVLVDDGVETRDEHDDDGHRLGRGFQQRLPDPFREQRAVRQVCERVMQGLMVEAQLHQPALGDVRELGQEIVGITLLVANQGQVRADPDDRAVRPDVATFVGEGVVAGRQV